MPPSSKYGPIFRHCLVSTTDVQAVQKSDGKWTVEGVEAEQFVDTLLLMERFARPFNSTFYATQDTNECVQRIINNESDTSNLLLPQRTDSPYIYVPVSVAPGKVEFMSGYGVKEGEGSAKETATVLSNVDLLDGEVYGVAFALVVLFVIVIAIRLWMLHSHRGRQVLRPTKRLVDLIAHELSGVFYQSNERFKLIATLYSILYFYILTSLLCLYKTSQVIVDKPFYPTSYQESLDDVSSLILPFDQFSVSSVGFRDSPVGSVKHKLWQKLVASGMLNDSIISGGNNPAVGLMKLPKGIIERKSIGVANSVIMPLLKSFACGFSPEDQLWFLKLFADPSEPELIYGFPFSRSLTFEQDRQFKISVRRILEGHIAAHHYSLSVEVAHIANRIAGTTRSHHWRQKLACTDEDALASEPHVKAIPLSYFSSFFMACAVVWAVAFILNFIQIEREKRRMRARASRRR